MRLRAGNLRPEPDASADMMLHWRRNVMIGINGTLALMVATAAVLTPPAASAQHAHHGTRVTPGADAVTRAATPATTASRAPTATTTDALTAASSLDDTCTSATAHNP